MTSADVSRIRLRSPGELIEAVPYLLGFHPSRSLVMVGFRTLWDEARLHHQVTVTVRRDLPPACSDAAEAQGLITALRQAGSVRAALVVYAELPLGEAMLDGWRRYAVAVSEAVERSGIQVVDVLLADDHRWWSLICASLECCPRNGTRREIGYSVAAAQATLAGLVALPDRTALLAQFEGQRAAERDAMEPLLARAENRLVRAALANGAKKMIRSDTAALIKAARQTSCGEAPPIPPHRLARFGVALGDIAVRDSVWIAVDEAVVDVAPLMGQLFRALPAPYDAAPLFLFGWQQWRAGNGTLALMAAERAIASDSRYTAAKLLARVVETGMDPRTTPRMRRGEQRSSSHPGPVSSALESQEESQEDM